MKLNVYRLVLSLILVSCSLEASRTLDYDQIRQEGGFQSNTLSSVSCIVSTRFPLMDIEKTNLIQNINLFNLKKLDLAGQNIDDNFIVNLCNNKNLRRIINLDISNNQDITNNSITSILKSDFLGSLREVREQSSQFGSFSTTVCINAKNTSINSDHIKFRDNFLIYYLHPIANKITHKPDNGIKLVEVTFK